MEIKPSLQPVRARRHDARDFILKEMRQQRRVNPHDYGVPWEKVTSQPRP